MFVSSIGGQKENNCTTFIPYFSKTNFCSPVLSKVTAVETYQILILMHSIWLNTTWIRLHIPLIASWLLTCTECDFTLQAWSHPTDCCPVRGTPGQCMWNRVSMQIMGRHAGWCMISVRRRKKHALHGNIKFRITPCCLLPPNCSFCTRVSLHFDFNITSRRFKQTHCVNGVHMKGDNYDDITVQGGCRCWHHYHDNITVTWHHYHDSYVVSRHHYHDINTITTSPWHNVTTMRMAPWYDITTISLQKHCGTSCEPDRRHRNNSWKSKEMPSCICLPISRLWPGVTHISSPDDSAANEKQTYGPVYIWTH